MRFVISLLVLLLGANLYAEKNGITIYGTYKVNGGDAEGVQIRLLRNGIKEKSSISGSGKFKYGLDFNTQYELSFSKSGYITKKIVISTDVPERVLESNSDFPPFKIEVELFPKVEGGDYSIFDEPVAMVIYDKELDDFDFDRAYDAEVKEEIKKVEAKIIQAPLATKPKIDKNSLLYKELIRKADSEFEAKSYVESRKTYGKALKLKPKEIYPQRQIELIDKTLADLKKQEEQKKQRKSYYALIDKADVLFEDKKYKQARSYYEEALKIKSDQVHPRDRIALIDQIFAQQKAAQKEYGNAVALGDRYFKESKYDLAKKSYEEALKMRKDESYPKEQIERIDRLLSELKNKEEKEQKYKEALAEADVLFAKESWADAKVAYEKATKFSDKKYPREQIKKIESILKEQKKSLDKYSKAIVRADEAFKDKDFKNAQKYYERAITFRPQEVYPKEQLKKITTLLATAAEEQKIENAYKEAIETADRAFRRKNWEDAKSAYFKALKVKPEEKYPQKQIKIIEEKLEKIANKKAEEDRYNQKLKEADTAYDQKNWSESLVLYKVALEMKPAEKYPKLQIRKIEKFLQEELKKKSAEEKEESYKAAIAKADKAYDGEQWEDALANYEGALQIKPKDKHARGRIKSVQKARKESEQKQALEQKYQAIIAKADDFFEQSKWLESIAAYNDALEVKSNEEYPKNQISKVKSKLSAEELAKEKVRKEAKQAELQKSYDEAIKKADDKFAKKRYGTAKFYYQEALSISAEEEYPKKKLTEIANILQKNEEATQQGYQKIVTDETSKGVYYDRIDLDTENENQRFVKVINVSSTDEKAKTVELASDNDIKQITKSRYVKKIESSTFDKKKYDALISKAESAEKAGRKSFARAFYRQAYLMNPSATIYAKLKELDNLMQLTKSQRK